MPAGWMHRAMIAHLPAHPLLCRFIPNVQAALAAFARVLKPGGALLATVAQPPDVQPFWTFLSELAEGGVVVSILLHLKTLPRQLVMTAVSMPQHTFMRSSTSVHLISSPPPPCRTHATQKSAHLPAPHQPRRPTRLSLAPAALATRSPCWTQLQQPA